MHELPFCKGAEKASRQCRVCGASSYYSMRAEFRVARGRSGDRGATCTLQLQRKALRMPDGLQKKEAAMMATFTGENAKAWRRGGRCEAFLCAWGRRGRCPCVCGGIGEAQVSSVVNGSGSARKWSRRSPGHRSRPSSNGASAAAVVVDFVNGAAVNLVTSSLEVRAAITAAPTDITAATLRFWQSPNRTGNVGISVSRGSSQLHSISRRGRVRKRPQ